MGIAVKFENPPGTVLTSRRFQPSQELRVGAYVTGSVGLGEPGLTTWFELYGNFPSMFTSTTTNLFGNAWVDWFLPAVVGKATVRVTAYYPIGANETVDIPIGIGVDPDPINLPGDTTFLWVIGAALLAGVVLVGIYRPGPIINTSQRAEA